MSETLREQAARIRDTAHKLQREGGNPDCVLVWKGSPLGRLTKATVATAGGELEIIPDPQCPRDVEYVGFKSDFRPTPAPLTHEERARAIMGLRYEDGKLTPGSPLAEGRCLDAFVAHIAAQFAEVAEEARREVVTAQVAAMTAGHVAETRARLDSVEIPRMPNILAAEPGSCRICGLAACFHPRNSDASY
jgi:hypothetical protein